MHSDIVCFGIILGKKIQVHNLLNCNLTEKDKNAKIAHFENYNQKKMQVLIKTVKYNPRRGTKLGMTFLCTFIFLNAMVT